MPTFNQYEQDARSTMGGTYNLLVYLTYVIANSVGTVPAGSATAANQLLQLTQETNIANRLIDGGVSAATRLTQIKGGTDNLDTQLSTRASASNQTTQISQQTSGGNTTAGWLEIIFSPIYDTATNTTPFGGFSIAKWLSSIFTSLESYLPGLITTSDGTGIADVMENTSDLLSQISFVGTSKADLDTQVNAWLVGAGSGKRILQMSTDNDVTSWNETIIYR